MAYSSKNPYNDLLYQVNLDPEEFNALVAHHGIRIKIEKTTICPAYKANVNQNRHEINCELCENGFLHFEETEIYGFFQQNLLNKIFLERGAFVPGQALLTIPSEKERTVLNISAYTTAQNATIVSPAIPFLSDGQVNGSFTVASITGLELGDEIQIDDDDSPALSCKIRSITGAASPYTIVVEQTEGNTVLVGLFDRITLLDQEERFYELLNKSRPDQVDLTAYTTAQNATIVSPAIPFLSNGTATGTFTVNSIAGISAGDLVAITDDNSSDLEVLIMSISGSASPYTITVRTENLVDNLRYGAVRIDYITTEARGDNPFTLDVDYEVDSDGNIEWLTGGSRPSYDPVSGVGEAFTVAYVFRPVYRVISMMHEGRYSQEAAAAGKVMTRFPQQMLIRKDYYVKPEPALPVNDQEPGDDPDEPADGGW